MNGKMDRDLQRHYLNAFPKHLAEDVLAVLNYILTLTIISVQKF